jgi:imidazolonepropionase-like amidohydrolase
MRKYFLLPVFILSLNYILSAQPVEDDLPQITGCIALINAKVVSAPGKPPVVSSVVMRDGLITHIGPNLKIPADAFRIAADSFYVYPAFIDALSNTGIKEAEEISPPQGPANRGSRPAFDADGNPSLEDAGITPFNDVRSTFDPKEKSISDWRAQGFAVAHVVPKGKMMPGKGSVVVLSGKDTDQLLWKEDISMYAQWTGAGGGYPATVIGIMAKWRELYHNATQAVAHESSYDQATLVSRPKYNHAHEALKPVVTKDMTVYFRAPKVKDISRALSMQQELGMKMVITDAEEAWYLKDRFKSGDIPLILSLDLPEDKSDEKAKAEAEAKDSTLIDTIEVVLEKKAFEKKRSESLKAYQQQAGVLAKEGIAFSFSTMSVKSGDFSKNISTMIENGLPAESALNALTTQPASLLGIDKYCGTVEVGKMANVIVSTKPLFEKEAAIKYMIVEGTLYQYEIKEKKKAGEKTAVPASFSAVTGIWEYIVETPGDQQEGTIEFKDENGTMTGILTSDDNTTGNDELENIVIDENDLSFTFDVDMGGQMVELEFDLKLDGETFEGSVSVGEFGTFTITGKRTVKPN